MLVATVIILYVLVVTMSVGLVSTRIRLKYFDFWGGVAAGSFFFIAIPLSLVVFEGELPAPIDFIGTNIPLVSLERDAPSLILALGNVLSVLLTVLIAKRSKSLSLERFDIRFKVTYLLLAYLALSVGIFAFAGMAEEGAHWYESKEEFLSNYGLAGVLASYTLSALKMLTFVIVVSQFLAKEISLGRFLLLGVAVSIIDLYTTGNRIFTLLVVVLVFFSLFQSRRYFLVAAATVLAAPFAYAMSLFRWVRSYMHSEGAGSLDKTIDGVITGIDFALNQGADITIQQIVSGATESVNLNVLIAILSDFGDQLPFLEGQSLLKLLVFWVPRSFWPDKPDSIAVVIGQYLAPGQGVALIATFYGEMFANFGYFSFVVAPVALLVAKVFLDRMFGGFRFHGALSFLFGFLLIRMPFSDVLLVGACVGAICRFGRLRRSA